MQVSSKRRSLDLHQGAISRTSLVALCLSLGVLPTSLFPAQRTDFTDCRQLFLAAPDEPEGSNCFYRVARSQDRWGESYKPIEDLLTEFPNNKHLLRERARVERNRDKRIKLYLDALRKAEEERDSYEEIALRDGLWHCYYWEDALVEAEEQILSAEDLRSRRDEPLYHALLDLLIAHHARYVEEDFAATLDLLEKHEAVFSERGPDFFRREFFWIMGGTMLELGAPAEALEYYKRAAWIAAEEGDLIEEIRCLGDGLAALRDLHEDSSDPKHQDEAEQFVRELLDKAVTARKTTNSRRVIQAEAKGLLLLGELLRGEGSKTLYQRCVELTRSVDDLAKELKDCRLALATEVAKSDPDQAMQMVAEALEPSPLSEALLRTTIDLQSEMRVLWETKRYEEAWIRSKLVLDAIDDLRSAQPERYGRAHSFSPWAPTYLWLAGRLLKLHEETLDPQSLPRAFEVIERMRARVLLEILETREVASNAATEESSELGRARSGLLQLLEEKSILQRQLRLGLGTERSRQLAAERVGELHDKEARLRREIARLSGWFRELETPDFATIGDIQSELGAHEAVLSFHLAPWESVFEPLAGGSWLTLVSRDKARAYALPNLSELSQRVSVFTGALDQGKWLGGLAVRLYQDLLATALSELSPRITDLILIPDKALHKLPIAALRPSEGAPPLAARYRISRVPSATLWLRRWREQAAPPPAIQPALVLADPLETNLPLGTVGSRSPSTARDGVDGFFRASSYGPLPFARQEGWSVRRHLGPRTEIVTGPYASESFLQEVSLGRFGIFHFAAHAIANEEDPELAGVRLAPDLSDNGAIEAAANDGLLQFHEIVDLGQNGRAAFAGRTVVLSTCHSARGQILRGEGVFDLARAFFEGGARAVVGSLWKLEDKATAEFFDDFYRHLARGISLSEALHRAQKDQIDRGVPPSVWAGIVVIGDGSLVPVPSRKGRQEPFWPIALAVVLLLVAVAVAARRNP